LVIAPHPDDEVLGCGGSIAKHAKNGDIVELCIVTKAYRPDWSAEFLRARPKEIRAASRALGIAKVAELGFPTVKLDKIPQKELNDALAKVVSKARPDVLYIPHFGDLNKDHRLVSEAAMVAARPSSGPAMKVLSYETLSETDWGRPLATFIPNHFVDITGTMDAKLKAMGAYRSELRKFPHPRSLEAIEALAMLRGSECGRNRAEAFHLIREVL